MVVLFTGLRLWRPVLEGGRGSSRGNPILRIPRLFVESIGRASKLVTEHAGQLGLLLWQVLIDLVRLKVSYREILRQIYVMGSPERSHRHHHCDSRRDRHESAGRVPVHGYDPPLCHGEHRNHQRGPGAGPGSDRHRFGGASRGPDHGRAWEPWRSRSRSMPSIPLGGTRSPSWRRPGSWPGSSSSRS